LKRMVLGFAFTPDFRQVALIEKINPDWQRGKLNGVGGKVEPTDEDGPDAIAREFEEETGVYISPWNWSSVGRMTGLGWQVDVFAVADAGVSLVRTVEAEKVSLVNSCAQLPAMIDNVPLLIAAAKLQVSQGAGHVTLEIHYS
jgi:8-oxo-dGTP diphosphatase